MADRFEYNKLHWPTDDTSEVADPLNWPNCEQLDALGADGWELICVTSSQGVAPQAFFKRKAQ